MIATALYEFFARSLEAACLPRVAYVPGQCSPCCFGGIDDEGLVRWRPVRRDPVARCGLLSTSVPEGLPDPVHEFFGSYYTFPIEFRLGPEYFILDCGASSDDDFARKQRDLVEHLTWQRESGRELDLPVAWSVSGGERYLGFHLASGAIWEKVVGEPPSRRIAPSLPTLLASIQYAPSHMVYDAD